MKPPPPTEPVGELRLWASGDEADEASVSQVTRLLQVEPTRAARRGAVLPDPRYHRIARTSSWRLQGPRLSDPLATAFVGLSLAGAVSGLMGWRSDRGAPCAAQPAGAKIAPASAHTGLEGGYDLTVVSQGPQLAGKHVTGRLWLWRSSAADSSPKTGKHAAPGDTVGHPYFGATNLDLWELTTRGLEDEATARARVDPIYPQVLLSVRGWPPGEYTTWKELTIWIESVGNLRDGSMALDGAGFVLDVLRLRDDGFDGRWGPAGIVQTDTGYFCARRRKGTR
ncbi:MAG TPA: hypothetical protein VJQ44_07495 [Gemmatimonadales bacterium]|nr:hypothetical protein [Gemmatimonadales bacterium]